jgi:hypothetical protein
MIAIRAKREASMRVSPARGVIREYQKLSPEDQRTFERWLKANTVFAAILAVGWRE